jgi:hypothetical protein
MGVEPTAPRCLLLLHFLRVQVYLDQVAHCGKCCIAWVCLECKGESFSWNGGYLRWWVDDDGVCFRLRIRRIRCRRCRVGWTLLPGFVVPRLRYCCRWVEWSCWRMLAGHSPAQVHRQLVARISRVVLERCGRAPVESTIRSWPKLLARPHLQYWVRRTLSFIAGVWPEVSPSAYRLLAAPQSIAPQLPVAHGGVLAKAGQVLRACVALQSPNGVFRRRPHQFRNWVRWIFCQARRTPCRPP